MDIRAFIKSSEQLHFWGRVLQNCKSQAFREDVISLIEHPAFVKIENRGEKNADRCFYVVNIDDGENHSGFFALLNDTVKRLELARRIGADPYVEWWNTSYSAKGINAFELYFRQMTSVARDEIQNSANIIYSNIRDGFARDVSQVYKNESDYILKLGSLYKKYIILQDNVKLKVDSDLSSIPNLHQAIGVHIRGTDYYQKLKGHPVYVTFEEYADEIDRIIRKYGERNIFLATDDVRAVVYLKKRFADRVYYYADVSRGKGKMGVHYSQLSTEKQIFRLGYEVVRDVITLSKCGFLVAGVSNVSTAVRALKFSERTEFKVCRIIDKGVNSNGITSKKVNKRFNKIKH